MTHNIPARFRLIKPFLHLVEGTVFTELEGTQAFIVEGIKNPMIYLDQLLVRNSPAWFVELPPPGYCADIFGICEPNERCYCHEE